METIGSAKLELRVLRSKETGGSLDLFEMTVQPQARMPVAHHHAGWEETIDGLAGVTTWLVDGGDVAVGPGATLLIRRGVVHGFRNDPAAPASALCIRNLGVLSAFAPARWRHWWRTAHPTRRG